MRSSAVPPAGLLAARPRTPSVLRGNATGHFASVQQAHAGNYPTGIASGDFNNDRRLDVVITDPASPGLNTTNLAYIYLQDPSGTLVRTQTYAFAGTQTRSAQAGDVNRDGNVDIVAATGSSVQLLRGRGDGSFDVLSPFGSCAVAHFFKGFADFDRNQTPDFAIACAGASAVAVFLNDGSGNFTQRTLVGSRVPTTRAWPTSTPTATRTGLDEPRRCMGVPGRRAWQLLARPGRALQRRPAGRRQQPDDLPRHRPPGQPGQHPARSDPRCRGGQLVGELLHIVGVRAGRARGRQPGERRRPGLAVPVRAGHGVQHLGPGRR